MTPWDVLCRRWVLRADRSWNSATQTYTATPSFLLRSACGTLCRLTYASCYLPGSKLSWTLSSWCKWLPSLFLSSAQHCFYPSSTVPTFVHLSTLRTWYPTRGAILLNWVSTWYGRKRRSTVFTVRCRLEALCHCLPLVYHLMLACILFPLQFPFILFWTVWIKLYMHLCYFW